MSERVGEERPMAPDDERRRLLAFLRKLPHDFANAILPFRIAGDLLRRADGDPAILDQVSRILEDQSQQAQRLIDDLDRTVRVLLGEIPTRPRTCDLEQVVAQGISAPRRARPPSVEIAMTPPRAPIEIEADPTQLSAAVEELVDNAARFAGRRPISVELERTDGDASIRVRDGGPGIAQRSHSSRSSSRSSPPTPSTPAGESASVSSAWWPPVTAARSRRRRHRRAGPGDDAALTGAS